MKLIESPEGSIYLRGGIAGKNRAVIRCKGNLYAKYISDAEVVCEGSVYAGFYIRNSNIRAKQVIVESGRGQIVGGLIDADVRVECADIGNRMETRTLINVRGFSRESMKAEMDELLSVIQDRKKQLADMKVMFRSVNGISKKNKAEAQRIQQEMFNLQEELKRLEAQCLNISGYLKTPGEGAVVVKNYIYPMVRITIRNEILEILNQDFAPTYIYRDGKLESL